MEFSAAHHGSALAAGRFAGAFAVVAVVALVAGGCTTADSTTSPSATPSATPPPTTEAPPATFGLESNPVAVSQRFYDAILNGEDEVICALLTPKYGEALTRTHSTATCPEAAAKTFAETRARHQRTPLQFKAQDARISADGQSAIVRVSGGMAPQKGRPEPQLNYVTLNLVRKGEGWLIDPPTETAAPAPG